MSKEDIRHFKLYASRMDYEQDRKDVRLFNSMRAEGKNFDEEKSFLRLYKKGDKNSFYRLKNRLLDHLNKSLLLQHMDNDEAISIHALLSLYKFHANKRNFEVAKYFLTKAERKAIDIEYVELLDIIYSEFIKLSNEIFQINPEVYIQKRKTNSEQLNRLREIDQVLAAVSYRLKIGQNYSSSNQSIVKLLEKTIKDFSKDKTISGSKTFQVKVASALSKILLQKHDYVGLENYLTKTFQQLMKQKAFNKGNHEIKLQLLTYLVNSLFKNKKYDLSLSYAAQLHASMLEFEKMLYDKFLIFYYSAIIGNYSATKIDKAIELLEQLKAEGLGKKNPFYEFFIYLNLGICYFDKKQFDKAIKHIIKMSVMDSYKKADAALKLKIAIAELMIRLELNEYETLEYRIKQTKKDFKNLLSESSFKKEYEMLNLVSLMMHSPSISRDKKLQQQLNQFIKTHQKASDDTDVIKYIPWLKSKVKINLTA